MSNTRPLLSSEFDEKKTLEKFINCFIKDVVIIICILSVYALLKVLNISSPNFSFSESDTALFYPSFLYSARSELDTYALRYAGFVFFAMSCTLAILCGALNPLNIFSPRRKYKVYYAASIFLYYLAILATVLCITEIYNISFPTGGPFFAYFCDPDLESKNTFFTHKAKERCNKAFDYIETKKSSSLQTALATSGVLCFLQILNFLKTQCCSKGYCESLDSYSESVLKYMFLEVFIFSFGFLLICHEASTLDVFIASQVRGGILGIGVSSFVFESMKCMRLYRTCCSV